MKRLAALLWYVFASGALGQEAEHRYRLTSLFDPERADDFRAFMGENFPEVKVLELSVELGEVTLVFDPRKLKPFQPAGTPEVARQRLSFLMRGASRGMFDVLPVLDVPLEEMAEARIPVQGLDCRGCSYGAHLAIARLEGVAQATASFKLGEVRVRFDRRKTSLQALEETLSTKSIAAGYRIDETSLVPFSEMRVLRCSSEEPASDELYFHSTGLAKNAIDGDIRTKWSSRYSKNEVAPLPHELVIDLGRTRKVSGFRYLPRQIGYNGLLGETEFFVGDNPVEFTGQPAARGIFSLEKCAQAADCPSPVSGRYVLVRVLSLSRGTSTASIAELAVVESP
jgi:copper chaperone CopZ